MPNRWVPAEEFVDHTCVVIYHVYVDDDMEVGRHDYRYGWTKSCSEDMQSFDIRDLPNPNGHDVDTDDGRMAIIRDAIDAGVLTQDGVVMPENGDS